MIDFLSLIWKDCPECGGTGRDEHPVLPPSFKGVCQSCDGEGRIPRYFTSSELEKETGIKCGPDTPVWREPDSIIDDKWVIGTIELCKKFIPDALLLVAIPGQPRPADDYRHEVK